MMNLFGGYGMVPLWAFLIFTVAIAAIAGVYVLILPEKDYGKLPRFFKWLADFFNGKKLWLESTLKFIYISVTIFYLVAASFSAIHMLFSGAPMGFITSLFGGLLAAVIVRLFYEGISLGILLVKNTIEINKKLKSQNGDIEDAKIGE